MTRIKLSGLRSRLADIDYPADVEQVGDELGDTVVELADGEVALTDVLEDVPDDRYGSADELEADVYAALPTEAVGEPGQSEGDA
jgi:hypothetical protein